MTAKPCSAALFGALIVIVALSACGAPPNTATNDPAENETLAVAPVTNADIAIALNGVLGMGHAQTLVEDIGWGEFVLSVSNRSAGSLIVHDVTLLDDNGRYRKSASSYAQITAPPDAGTEVAGDVARTGSGLVLGNFIPFGGVLSSLLWGAASASSAEGHAKAQRAFTARVLKAVELAPNGEMTGSAFLPDIANAKALVVDYSANGANKRIELPFIVVAQPG